MKKKYFFLIKFHYLFILLLAFTINASYLSADQSIVLNDSAKLIFGQHDFTLLSKFNPEIKSRNCIIYESYWSFANDEITYNITSNRFLHHIVRYLVGSMIAISKGKYSIEQLKNELDNPNSDSKQFKAPAYGLLLNHISYE